MRNPFISIANKKSKSRFYLKTYDTAVDVLSAVALCNGLSRAILDLATVAMNVKNECEVDLQELDKALGIKSAVTRTKALNILRLMNLIETTTGNRSGVTKFRINFRAFTTDVESEAAKGKGFNEPLYFDALDENGFIKEKAIKNYKARKTVKVDIFDDIEDYAIDASKYL